jgi:hypothetical protein
VVALSEHAVAGTFECRSTPVEHSGCQISVMSRMAADAGCEIAAVKRIYIYKCGKLP